MGKKNSVIMVLALLAVLAVGILIGYLINRPSDNSNQADSEKLVIAETGNKVNGSLNASAEKTEEVKEADINADGLAAEAENEGSAAESGERNSADASNPTENTDTNADNDAEEKTDNNDGADAEGKKDSIDGADVSGNADDSEGTDANDNTGAIDSTNANDTKVTVDGGNVGADADNSEKNDSVTSDSAGISADEGGSDKSGNDSNTGDKSVTDNTGTDKTTGDKAGTDKTGNDKNSGAKTEKDNNGSDKSASGKTDDSAKKEVYTLTYSSDNSWQNGDVTMFGTQFAITNGSSSTVSGWKLVMNIEGFNNIEGWNGSFSSSGSRLTVTDAGYNADIYAGGTVVFGGNLGIKGKNIKISSATLNGHDMVIKTGKVDQNNQNNNPVNNGNPGGGDNSDQNGGSGSNDNTGNDATDRNSDNLNVNELLKRSEKAVQGDDWLHTDGRRILDKNGKQVWLTGLNWFGYNTGTNTFDGLWNSQLEPTVKAIADHGFNLIRVPISAELINQWADGSYPQANYNNAYNSAMNSMNSLEIFDYFLSLAEASGIKVMPDIHSAETNASGHNVNLWYTSKVTINDYYRALEWMADRYKNNDTIIAFDLKNEPHGKPYEGDGAAIWNDSKKNNNWKYVAETAAKKILAKNPNVLIMVEGTEIYPVDLKKNSDYHSTNDKDYYFNWWGGNLRAVADYPIDLGKYQNKLVYSPHDYGPTVFEQPWFKGSYNYDSLMKDCWHDNWFYIYEKNIAPLLIGEWGGFMTKPNITWMTHMRTLIGKYHLNHTFWCLNANSGDTGGLLLDDFKSWDSEKYKFVKEVLWQEGGKFVGLDHAIPLGDNGITLGKAKGLK